MSHNESSKISKSFTFRGVIFVYESLVHCFILLEFKRSKEKEKNMREEEIGKLSKLLKLADSGFVPPLIFVNGSVGSGKSFLIQQGTDSISFIFV